MDHQNIQMLRIGEVCRRTGLSKSQIFRLVDGCGFPAPIKLSARATAWIEAEVEGWLRARITATRQAV